MSLPEDTWPVFECGKADNQTFWLPNQILKLNTRNQLEGQILAVAIEEVTE